MKRARADQEVATPTGQRFIVGWAAPRDVERTFGRGRWGVQVMRRDGRFSMPVVHIEQVPDEVAGQAELRRLSAAIASGRWTPPNIVVAGRRVTELPTWAYGPSTFALVLVVTLGTGGGVVVSGIGALLLAVFVGVVGWRRSRKQP